MTRTEDIEPYALSMTIEGRMADPRALIETLLMDVGEHCEEVSGRPLVGHIKCHVSSANGNFHCSLASLRIGAHCTSLPSSPAMPLRRISVDLAILVYGVKRETIEAMTRTSIDALCTASGLVWKVSSLDGAHSHTGSSRTRPA